MSRKFRRKRKEQEIADGFYDEVRRKENSAEKFFGKVGRGEISHETTEHWDKQTMVSVLTNTQIPISTNAHAQIHIFYGKSNRNFLRKLEGRNITGKH